MFNLFSTLPFFDPFFDVGVREGERGQRLSRAFPTPMACSAAENPDRAAILLPGKPDGAPIPEASDSRPRPRDICYPGGSSTPAPREMEHHETASVESGRENRLAD
jgi:hypothetical protein